MNTYSAAYYHFLRNRADESARQIVPLVLDLVGPKSVIDVGCGVGTWLHVFAAKGVIDICGIDRPGLLSGSLDIEPEQFLGHDLNKPLRLDRTYDLVISLEVGEHLPSAAADQYVGGLTALGPVVLFSAAVPYQGGEHHVNEQWPAYWIDLFSARGYQAVDFLRPQIWESPGVAWWYAQNLLVFVNRTRLGQYPQLRDAAQRAPWVPPALVHPQNYLHAHWRNRVLRAMAQLIDVIPDGHCFVLVDQDQFGAIDILGKRLLFRFSVDGQSFGGPPKDDTAAIETLGQLKRLGASFLVLGWPAYWWITHYRRFALHLQSAYVRAFQSNDMIVYDLRQPREADAEGGML